MAMTLKKHTAVSAAEAANRLAIRELVEAYAYCADRRDAAGQMALFTPDTHFVVYMDAKSPTPTQELHSRESLAPVFADLNRYYATMHFVGQSTILSLERSRATGQAYCLAHHLTVDGDQRRLMVATLRYLDIFSKMDGVWLFAERRLYVDWLEERSLSPLPGQAIRINDSARIRASAAEQPPKACSGSAFEDNDLRFKTEWVRHLTG